MEYRDKNFKSKLRTHAGAIRKKVRVEEEEIKRLYREKGSLELGDYRHSEKYCNYNYLVDKVVKKWEERDERLALEIIHSLQNKVNSMILECILEEHTKIVEEKYTQ